MRIRVTALLLAVVVGGCVTLPPDAFVVTPESLKQRQLETRRYSGIKENDLLVACSNVLQDLGFTLENSETKLGVLTATKQRDAMKAREVLAAVIIALFGGGATPISKDQTIRVSLVARPVQATKDSKPVDEYFVRVTFQRIIRRTDNSEIAETLSNPELLQEFFDKLSKSIFLEGHKI